MKRRGGRAGDVHRTDEAHRQLSLELLGRQFLEVSGVKAGRIVGQHVDAAEPVDDGSEHGSYRVGLPVCLRLSRC